MSTKLDEAVELLKLLPDNEQERAAKALLAFAFEKSSYTLTDDDLIGIDHAIGAADRGEFTSAQEIDSVLGQSL